MVAFKKQIYDTVKEGDVIKTYDDPSILNDVETFFNNFNITLHTKIGDETEYRGGMSPSSLKYHYTWYCEPLINLTITAPDIKNLANVLSFCIAHELTHCYNVLQYSIQTNQDVLPSLKKNRYFDIKDKENSIWQNEKVLSHILYSLNRVERNAYLAQLRQELNAVKDKMTDDKAIFNLITNTESYKRFKNIENNINILNKIKDEDVKTELTEYINNMMNKKFGTFNQTKKYLNGRWEKWKKAYLSKATKIAYDVFLTTNHSKWLDWGVMGNDDTYIQT